MFTSNSNSLKNEFAQKHYYLPNLNKIKLNEGNFYVHCTMYNQVNDNV